MQTEVVKSLLDAAKTLGEQATTKSNAEQLA